MPTIISQNTTWRKGEVINMTTDFQIASGATLTIEPGTTINGNGNLLTVFGNVIFQGNATSHITTNNLNFSLSSNSNQVGNIQLDYVDLNNGNFLAPNGYGMYGKFDITNSNFVGVGGFYIWYPTSPSTFVGNTFYKSSGLSIGTNGTGSVLVKNNSFTEQTTSYAVESWANYNSGILVVNNSFLTSNKVALAVKDKYDAARLTAIDNYFGTSDLTIINSMILDQTDSLTYASVISTSYTAKPSSSTPTTAPAANSAPVANAGTNQSVVLGNVTLDGTASFDANNDALTFKWSLVNKPAGSSVALSSATSAKPTFTADVAGTYVLTLIVNDGKVDSAVAAVSVTASAANSAPVTNFAPIANAGLAQSVIAGSVVTLDGTSSTDANNDPLTYKWFLTSNPYNSTATLSSSSTVKPTFITDIAGTYVFSLIVNDGKVDSAVATIAVKANSAAISDTTPPSIRLLADTTALIAGQTKNITFFLSEPSSNFLLTDITVTGGALSNWVGYGDTYTALFTPATNSTADGVVSVGSGVFTDTAQNANVDGSDANNTITLNVDTVIPTIALSTSKTNLIAGETATLTFVLSEASTTFSVSDVSVTGGVLSNFTGSRLAYTATFIPAANSTANGLISVPSGVFTDAAGNKNADGSDANNSISFSRIPTITNETHTLSVIVDKNVLGPDAVFLKGLKESLTITNGAISMHIVEYNGLIFDYNQIDSFIATVTRSGEFTSEFTKEINDYVGAELNITYAAAVKLVGSASIDGVILSVAGADGNFVG